MLGDLEIKPEQHRYPFLASLLCIPSQDAIVENEGAAGPEEDDEWPHASRRAGLYV